MTIGNYQFCEDELWNTTQIWNSEVPKLTKCFAQVGLTLIPNLVIFLLLPIEIKFILQSKNKPIRFNRYNVIRFLICLIGLFCNLKLFFDYAYDFIQSSDDSIHTLSDPIASASNVFLFIFLIIIFYHHKSKGIITSGVIFFLSLIITVSNGFLFLDTLLYNESMYHDFEVNNIYQTFFCSLSLFATCFITDDAVDAGLRPSQNENLLNNVERNSNDNEEEDDTPEISPSVYSSFISKITYGWFYTVVRKCSKREIKLNEIYDLEDDLKVDSAVECFNKVYYKELDRIKHLNLKSPDKKVKFNSISLLKVIIKVYWKQVLFFLSLKTLADINTFSLPLLLNLLMDFLEKQNEPKWHGFFIAMGFITTSSLKILLTNINNMESYRVGMNAKSALSMLVFEKAQKLSPKAKKKKTTGQIINLFSVDSSRFDNFAPFFVYYWSSPFQIFIAFYLLYRILGFAAFAGAVVIILVMVLQYFLNRYKDTYLSQEMEVNDKRVNLVNEVLSGMKIIKLYGWEPAFLDKITAERNKQSNLNKKIYYLEMILNFVFYSFSPFVIFTSTMAIYMFLQQNDLTAQTVFVSLTIFGLLDYPIQELPELISYTISVKVSLKRLSQFLSSPELDPYVERKYDNMMALTIKNKAKFVYECKNNEENSESEDEEEKEEEEVSNQVNKDSNEPDKGPFELKDIELEIKRGSFTVIIGQVGSGKSSLISAIIGDMHLVENDLGIKGEVNISEDQNICYVAQQAWIQHTSFKNNILFGRPFNKFQYEHVIKACALEPDLKQFEAGDETEIGEKGINLSGGQKQRVSIARACYTSLSTNNVNQIILLDDPLSAVDAHVGKHLCENVLNSKTGLLKGSTRILVTNQLNQLNDLNVDQIILLKDGKIELKCTYDKLMELEMLGELDKYNLRLSQNEKSEEIENVTDKSKEKNDEKSNEIKEEKESTGNKTLVEEEKRQIGKVQLKNHLIYFKYFGFHLFLIALVFMVCENLFQILSRVYLANWTNSNLNDTHSDNETKKNNLLKYMGITFIQMVSNIFANILIVVGILNTLKKFHKKLLESVLKSPMKFFDQTPIGRIINRFSRDMMTVDESLPVTIRELSLLIIRLLASILIIIYKQPNTILFYFGIFVVYYYIMIMYVETSRQFRRYENITESPVFSHLSETINGISTIKAVNKTAIFSSVLRAKMNVTKRCEWLMLSGNRWLKLFLNLLTNIIILIVTSQFIFNKDQNSAGNAGLLLSYVLVLTDNLSFVIRFMGLFETNSISVERINEYVNLESEDEWIKENNRPPLNWPKNGQIEFIDYSTRYREGTKLVLKNLSFKIDGTGKVGVVGRTGAGKSTITLALFRIIEPSQGKIIIDDIDISKIGLHDLRSKLSIIPQDPVIFTGTIRFNLDPFDRYSDKEIYESLEHAHLKQFVNSLEDGIQHKISEGGGNLSVGQRQLICLARALLRKSKILVLDEATASVDFATDELVQKTIRSEFKDCTTITIAHRLNTVLDSSKILVLDKGRLDEYDKPDKLLNNSDSSFYKMALKANII